MLLLISTAITGRQRMHRLHGAPEREQFIAFQVEVQQVDDRQAQIVELRASAARRRRATCVMPSCGFGLPSRRSRETFDEPRGVAERRLQLDDVGLGRVRHQRRETVRRGLERVDRLEHARERLRKHAEIAARLDRRRAPRHDREDLGERVEVAAVQLQRGARCRWNRRQSQP